MKKLEEDLSVGSVLMALLGLILLIFPSITNKVIVYSIGIALICYGAYRMVRYLRKDAILAVAEHDLSLGLICIVTGLFMLIYSRVVIGLLPFLFGLVLLFGGAMTIQSSFDMKRFGSANWTYHLLVGIAFSIIGLVALRNPFASAMVLTRFVGGAMLVEGGYMCGTSVLIGKLRKAFMSEDNIVDEQ